MAGLLVLYSEIQFNPQPDRAVCARGKSPTYQENKLYKKDLKRRDLKLIRIIILPFDLNDLVNECVLRVWTSGCYISLRWIDFSSEKLIERRDSWLSAKHVIAWSIRKFTYTQVYFIITYFHTIVKSNTLES